jgi:hypothetical protein
MLNEILGPLFENLQNRRTAAPVNPQAAEIIRAGRGAGLIALALYPIVLGSMQVGIDYGRLLGDFVRGPSAILMPELWVPLLAWMQLIVTGSLWLGAGARRSRGGRDMLLAARSLVGVAFGVGLGWVAINVTDAPRVELVLEFLAVWFVVSAATRLILALRGMRPERLPEPKTNPDLPMSGPASRDEARDGMLGRGQWRPPQLRD